MKSRYVFAVIVTIALVLVTIGLLQVVSANNPGDETISWTGAGGTNDWGTATNWNPVRVPNTSDKVFIDSGSGVTISSGSQHVIWLHSHQPISISGGSLTLDESSLIANTLTMNGGTLIGAGDLAISGLFTWSGGQLSGSGSTTANGGISITGTESKQLWDRTLNNGNNGTCTYDGSNFGLYLSSFNNQAGATFNLPTDGTIGTIVGGTFNNSGTFNRTTTSGTATIQVAFNNSGTVNVQSGMLRPETNGTHTGLFNVSSGAVLSLPSGTQQLNGGSNVSGAGRVDVSGATVNVAGSYDLTGPTNVSGGTLAFNSSISTPTALNFSGGTVEGSGNFTVTGLFTWSGGQLRGSGSTTANGGISITGTGSKQLWDRTLNNGNNGTCTYDGSNFGLYLSTFNNQAGATFNLSTDNPIVSIVGGTFNNSGTFNRTTTSGTATIQVAFNNSGTVDIQSGTLSLQGAFSQTADGSIVLNGGSLSTGGTLSIQLGALKGYGNITGDVTIGTGGAVDIELGGTTPGNGVSNYDQLNISGTANLAGSLDVSLPPGFMPAIGDTFTVMMFGSSPVTFATTHLPTLSGKRAWGPVAYNPGSVVLSVVAGSNHPPVAASDAYSTNEDTPLNGTAPGVLGNDSDADGDPLTAVLVGNVHHGTLILNTDGSFTYTPSANYSGSDFFTYKANDGTADSNVATVTITVNAVNDAPEAPTGGVAYSTDNNTVLNQAAPGVLGNVTDADGDPLTAILVSDVSHGILVLNADGSFRYTPAAGFIGSDSFTCKANDGTADSSVFTVTITVNAGNNAPVAPTGGVAYSTNENGVLNQAAPGVLGNVTDADGDPLTAILVSDVSHGTLVLNADGSFNYTPAAGFIGSDSFTCKANDGTADSSLFTVTITVNQLPASITSLDNVEAAPGETIRVVITGTKLGGATIVDFGPGVSIEGMTIDSATQITVDVKVASDAQSGLRDVSVTTPQGVATLTDAFTVKNAPSEGVPAWVWPVVALAVVAAGAGGFFLFFLLPRRKAKRS